MTTYHTVRKICTHCGNERVVIKCNKINFYFEIILCSIEKMLSFIFYDDSTALLHCMSKGIYSGPWLLRDFLFAPSVHYGFFIPISQFRYIAVFYGKYFFTKFLIFL